MITITRPRPLHRGALPTACAALILVGLGGVALATTGGGPTVVDQAWSDVMQGRFAMADLLASAADAAGRPLGSTLTALVLGGIIAVTGRILASIQLLLGVGLASALESLLKLLVHRPRPDAATIAVSGFSYPSGHVTAAAAIATGLILAFRAVWAWFTGTAWVLVMVGDRTYLHVHWITDCLAGAAVGAAVPVIVAVLVRAGQNRWSRHAIDDPDSPSVRSDRRR